MSIYTELFLVLEAAVRAHHKYLKDIEVINVGGGLGIDYYHSEGAKEMPTIAHLSGALPKNSPFTIMVEPGRSLIGNTAVLLTKVLGVKNTEQKNFVVVDSSMTELIRPALYSAFHNILPVNKGQTRAEDKVKVDFVGPVCESSDFLGKDRIIEVVPKTGDYFVVMDGGAYSRSMASNYNLRARPAEVLVDGDTFKVIQERETYEQVVGKLDNPGDDKWLKVTK